MHARARPWEEPNLGKSTAPFLFEGVEYNKKIKLQSVQGILVVLILEEALINLFCGEAGRDDFEGVRFVTTWRYNCPKRLYP